MEKINGFTRKLHPYQIISYIFFLGLAITYYFIIFPLSSDISKIISIIISSVSGVFIVISGYLATSIDPSDPCLIASRKARFEKKPYEPTIREFYCGADHTYVKKGSKHCRRCNRCTEEFDHHCKWINNDVGKANYRSFFVMICSVLVFLVNYMVFGIILTVNYANDNMLMNNNTYLYDDDHDRILGGLIVMWIMMVLASLFLMLDTNLVLFHIFLQAKGLTTFQYISIVEERKENMKELEQAMKMLGENRKTCLDFILCLKKRKPRATPAAPNNEGIELGSANAKDEKKDDQVEQENKDNNNNNDNKEERKHTENESPNALESPSPGLEQDLRPVKTEDDEKEAPNRAMNVSRQVNHTNNGPVVINIAHDQEKKRTGDKKHTVSQIEVELKKEGGEEQLVPLKNPTKVFTPSYSQPRVAAYSVGDNVNISLPPVASSQKNIRGSQALENSGDGLLYSGNSNRIWARNGSVTTKHEDQESIGRINTGNVRRAVL